MIYTLVIFCLNEMHSDPRGVIAYMHICVHNHMRVKLGEWNHARAASIRLLAT